jgi:hypothetical protein
MEGCPGHFVTVTVIAIISRLQLEKLGWQWGFPSSLSELKS